MNSAVQLCGLVNICTVLTCGAVRMQEALMTEDSELAVDVLRLVGKLRRKIGTRKIPRMHALLRWASGLAECDRGRSHGWAQISIATVPVGMPISTATGVHRSTSVAAVSIDKTRVYRAPSELLSRCGCSFHHPPTG